MVEFDLNDCPNLPQCVGGQGCDAGTDCHYMPQTDAELEALHKWLVRQTWSDGKLAECGTAVGLLIRAVTQARQCIDVRVEVALLKEVIRVNEICHDQHGKVGPEEFAQGCANEQRKLFGRAPHADLVAAAIVPGEPCHTVGDLRAMLAKYSDDEPLHVYGVDDAGKKTELTFVAAGQ